MNRREFNLHLMAAIPAITLPTHQSHNGQRVNQHLSELAQFGNTPEGCTQRVAYTDTDLQGREYAVKLMRGANKLDVSIDAAGNIVGRRAGSNSSLIAVSA